MEDFDDLNPEPDENGAVDMSQQVRALRIAGVYNLLHDPTSQPRMCTIHAFRLRRIRTNI